MFRKYFSIGILNTALHWLVFALCFAVFGITQATANLIAFLTAVTFSFFMNARFTFNKKPTGIRYLLFTIFMGILSLMIGHISDALNIYPILTLIIFSALSLILGFLYSKYIVFK